ncbi:MAG: hypothetical protein Q7U28_09130 [Aquabacterium sp.]|nr:hypothetical protein [Aquabacterium sp.]
MQAHPNNPYPAALFFWDVCAKANDDDEDEDEDEDDDEDMDFELANEIWPQMKACRSMFDSAMPRSFRGVIEPKLVGNGAANKPYFALLYWGAITASALGLDKDALAWARRSLGYQMQHCEWIRQHDQILRERKANPLPFQGLRLFL